MCVFVCVYKPPLIAFIIPVSGWAAFGTKKGSQVDEHIMTNMI